MSEIHEVLSAGRVTSLFQPIVSLDTGAVVAYEALARGPEGPLRSPDRLYAAARAAGLLAELDELCRRQALLTAIDAGIAAPLTLFINVEPEVLERAPIEELLRIVAAAPTGLDVVLEITERALASRPAELLATVRRLRAAGWRIALDDVGADDLSLAFMPLLRPDVVKLDLSLVQSRPGPAVAEIMNAVNAYAERTGAVLLAEGIEREEHLSAARALGARLGQGWMFGRPAPGPAAALPVAALDLPAPPPALPEHGSPFHLLPPGVPLRRSPKPLLVEVSKHLEREALRLGHTCVVVSTFQHARHFTPTTAHRYRELAERVGFVAAIGEGLPVEPAAGVRGADLSPGDAIRGEWSVAVLAPHFAAALIGRDLGLDGPDPERTFEFALTYDRDVVARAAGLLMSRVLPRDAAAVLSAHPVPGDGAQRPAGAPGGAPWGDRERVLRRALAATANGVTIADVTRPDQPLIYVNTAFERLSGVRAEDALGRNCRFLQGPECDPAAVARLRSAIAEGREVRETLLNLRAPDGAPWWNEVYLSPVFDDDGRLVQYIGVQNDVTDRVRAEEHLRRERERAESYASEIEQLANRDPLTGLLNRRGLADVLEATVLEARMDESGVALLFLDLDGFKLVNDRFGHSTGDELLVAVAGRLRARLRRGDLVARLGGDEFLVVVPGLSPDAALVEGHQIAADLHRAIAGPVAVHGRGLTVAASIGVSAFPDDGWAFDTLLHTADTRMYAAKHAAARS